MSQADDNHEDLAALLTRVTDKFTKYTLGYVSEPHFRIDRNNCDTAFTDCVAVLPLLDELLAGLVAPLDMVNFKAQCMQILKLSGVVHLDQLKKAFCDLRTAVSLYYRDFLCHKLVRACPPAPLYGMMISLNDFDDMDVAEPCNDFINAAERDKFSLEAIPKNIAVILRQLSGCFAVVNAYIQLQSPDTSLSNLSMHLSMDATPVMELKASNDEKKVHTLAQYVFNTLHDRRAHKVVRNKGQVSDPREVEVWTPIIHNHVSTGVYRRGLSEQTQQDGMSLAAYVNAILSPNAAEYGLPNPPIEISNMLPINACDKVARYVCHQSDIRFPFDDPNPHLIAFTNGVLNTLTATFHPTGGSDAGSAAAQLSEQELSDESMALLQKLAAEHNAKAGSHETAEQYLKTCTNTQPCMFVPNFYDPNLMTMTMEDLENKCTSLKEILEYQGIPNDPVKEGQEHTRTDVRLWIYALIGRTMIMYADRADRWQIALFFLGCAGTGKSTILNMIAKFFPPQTVKAMEDEGEGTFGLMTFVKEFTRIIIASEIPTTMPMAQIAKCISHEAVSVPIKHGGAMPIPTWGPEFVFAGNFFPQQGNTGGRMSRRYVIVPFNKPVTNQKSDIEVHIQQNLAAYITLCVRAYYMISRKYGKSDFFRTAPPFFSAQARSQYVQSNLLALYLSSPEFTFGPQYETPLPVIVKAAKEHARQSGQAAMADMRNQLITTNLTSICTALGLSLSDESKNTVWEDDGREYSGRCVRGIYPTHLISQLVGCC